MLVFPLSVSHVSLLHYTMVSFAFAMMLLLNLCIKSNAHLHIIYHLLEISPMNQLILLNLVLNIILLFGVFLKKIFFGSLFTMEWKMVQEFLAQFLLLKLILIATLFSPDVQLTKWIVIYAVFALFQTFSGLCKERYNNISTYAPLASIYHHLKLVTLLILLLIGNIAWTMLCYPFFRQEGLTFLLVFECLTTFLDTFQTIGKNVVNLVDIIVCGDQPGTWDTRSFLIHLIEFATDCLLHILSLLHHIHLVYLNGFSFSLEYLFVDFHLYLSITSVCSNLYSKIKSAQNYWKLTQDMDKRFTRISPSEIETMTDLTCAICRDDITASSGRRLPCDHVFHYSCLRSWLERESFCPICKRSLFPDKPRSSQPISSRQPRVQQVRLEQQQHLPHSVHQHVPDPTGTIPLRMPGPIPTAHAHIPTPAMPFVHPFFSNHYGFYNAPDHGFFILQRNIATLTDILPHIPVPILYAELLRTQSVDEALDNFLNGRVNLNMAE